MLNNYFSDLDYSYEVTTRSSTLLTDRTLALRAHKEIAESVLTDKCYHRLRKYNATLNEYYCVCWANCRWRPLTEAEVVIREKYRQIILVTTKVLQITLGTTYSVIFVLGVTGMIPTFVYSLHCGFALFTFSPSN